MGRRTDIQVLRGYAVLLVVIYHAGLKLLPGGFLGVDIFFVISGFLITGIIRRDIANQSFSLAAFYTKRAKRLFPAAYVTFLLTVLVSPYLLTSTEFLDYKKQLIGALSFTANYVLKNQTGYFDGAADLKPLLHTWSLSVEEQFYFLFPTILLLIPIRGHKYLFCLIFILSLAGCFLAKANPETIFYTLPYRAWELALGALMAQYAQPASEPSRRGRAAIALSTIVLFLLPLLTVSRLYPVPIALLACLATACILVIHAPLQRRGINQGMSLIGDFSYSIYLVHWPVFAFFNNILIESTPNILWIRAGLIVLALVLAFALYRLIERPCLSIHIKAGRAVMWSGIGAALLIALLGLSNPSEAISSYWNELRRPSVGLNKSCTSGPLDFAACRNHPAAQYLIWGDSMAMHLVNGLADSRIPRLPLVQATRHACAPFIGIADYRNKADTRYQWEATCIAFNDQVLEELAKDSNLNTVIISGNLLNYLEPGRLLVYRSSQDSKLQAGPTSSSVVFEAVKRTIDGIRQMGRRIVFISTPPKAAFDITRCLERRERSLLTIGGDAMCRIDLERNKRLTLMVSDFIRRLKSELGLNTITFETEICTGMICNSTIDGVPLYRDESHLSEAGGNLLIKKMKLVEQVNLLAR